MQLVAPDDEILLQQREIGDLGDLAQHGLGAAEPSPGDHRDTGRAGGLEAGHGIGDRPATEEVVAVRIALLVRSLQEKGNDRDGRTYQLFDTTVPAPNDRYLREVFTTTLSIRNRVRVD